MMAEESEYGDVLEEVVVLGDSNRPVRVAMVEQYDKVWLDIRSMYKRKDGTLGFGKGVRLDAEEGSAEIVMLAAQSLLVEFYDMDS